MNLTTIYVIIGIKNGKKEAIGFGSSRNMLDYYIDDALIDDGTYDEIKVLSLDLNKYQRISMAFGV